MLCDHALQFLESFNNIARKKRSFKTGKDVWLREEKLVEKMKAYYTYYRFLNKNIGGRIDWVATGLIDWSVALFFVWFPWSSPPRLFSFAKPWVFGRFVSSPSRHLLAISCYSLVIKKKTGGYDKKLVIWERKHSSEPAWICKHEAGWTLFNTKLLRLLCYL